MGIFHRKPNVKKMETEKDVEGLIKVLIDKNEDDVVRGNAARAISVQHKELKLRAIDPLSNVLYDPRPYVRWQVATTLFSIEDVKALRYLMKAIMDRNPDIVQDVIDGKQNAYWKSFIPFIKVSRSMLGEEPQDCCAIAWLLLPIFSEEDFVEKEIKKAIEKSPHYAPAHCLLGILWGRRASEGKSDERLAKNYSNVALKELQVAIELDPKDPLPYYGIGCLPFLSFDEKRKYYEQALKLDLQHSRFFWYYHWTYAMHAAEEKARGLSGDAFTRAIIVDPDRSSSVMPAPEAANGWAKIWWNTAKDEIKHYQGTENRKQLWKQE